MEILSHIGALLFIILWVLSILLNVFQPKWYWKVFIPKLHKNEEKHPVITGITLLFIVIIMIYGIISVIIRYNFKNRFVFLTGIESIFFQHYLNKKYTINL